MATAKATQGREYNWNLKNTSKLRRFSTSFHESSYPAFPVVAPSPQTREDTINSRLVTPTTNTGPHLLVYNICLIVCVSVVDTGDNFATGVNDTVRKFCSSQLSIKYYFPRSIFFHFISPHRPATWAGSRAGSPVSGSLSATTPAVNSRLSERHRGYTMTNNISNNDGT